MKFPRNGPSRWLLLVGCLASIGTVATLSGGSSANAAKEPTVGHHYSENSVPVTYETLVGTLAGGNPSGTFDQAEGTPGISQQQAVDLAWGRFKDFSPDRIIVGYLEWKGASSAVFAGGPIWVVSFQGGNICLPPPTTTTATLQESTNCGGTILTSVLDATSGRWVTDFENDPVQPAGSPTEEVPLDKLFSADN